MTRGRLAPSPTGAQHLGNARTHLLAYWAARQAGGELVLRIDDLDSPRVKSWAVDQAIEDLRWLGIDWDGPIARQSDHLDQYEEALERLKNSADEPAYPCYCSRKEAEEARSAPHESRFRGELPPYPGTCRNFRQGDRVDDRDHCWRFRVSQRQWSVDDQVMGSITCAPAKDLGDFPITTKSGQASYQLAVVVDDCIQGVDQVVRGNDLIASTFRQLELQERLGMTPPQYAHVALVRGPDGRRLAKRHGDTRLSFYRESGVAPEQIVGWAAHSIGLIDRQEPSTAADLIHVFDWNKLDHEDSQMDPETIF